MIDFPIDELLDEHASLQWLERYLHPAGLKCPRCGSLERRAARRRGVMTAYRCTACDCYHSILTGTVFEKTRQPPSKLVLFLRGIAKGESTARLARELSIGRARLHQLGKRVQANLAQTLPVGQLAEKVFEADELYQNAGEKSDPHRDPCDPPRRRANKRKGHGTYATDRPPIFSIVGRESGTVRFFVRHTADAQTCLAVVSSTVPTGATILYTDEWRGASASGRKAPDRSCRSQTWTCGGRAPRVGQRR